MVILGIYKGYIGSILGLYRGYVEVYVGGMKKKMEATVLSWV